MPRRAFTRDQAYLLPPALDDWVPADHPVRFVAAFVDGLTSADWAQLGVAARSAWTGAPAYHPEVLLSVWLAGFMSGVRSVRALEAACRDQLSFRWLTGNQVPDHNTLWRFYAVHRTQLPQLFQLTVKTAWKAGLVDLALLAVDGTKVAGNVARAGMQDAEALVALQMQVAARTAELVAQVEAEGATAAPRLPPELRQTRALQDRVTAARQAVTAEDGPTRANPVDADARLLPTRQGWIAGYNAQAAVVATPATVADEPGGRIIVAVDVVTAEHDAGQLLPVRDAAVATLGQAPETLLADGGYHRGPDLVGCAARGQVVVMPEAQGDRLQDPTHKDQFAYDPETDRYTCPQGQPLRRQGTIHRTDRPTVQRYVMVEPRVCRTCPLFGTCTQDYRHGRTLEIGPEDQALRAHRSWMATAEAEALRRERQTLIEPVFGILKERLGGRRFHTRGLAKVQVEWALLATGFNLRTLWRAWRHGPGVGGRPRGSGVWRRVAA